jgi:dCMP deaminase
MYMRIAEAVAITSSAKRLKVGAVAVKNNMVIGTGYNALPSGLDGELEDIQRIGAHAWSPAHIQEELYPYSDEFGRYQLVTKPEVRHAEKNLLLNLTKSTESTTGSTVFCTHSCCKFCAMDLVDAGIVRFVYKDLYRSTEGLEYLEQNKIKIVRLK